ncbi:hypothetical protein JTB14_037915 [Gonioctena quinquepunctata]|nr:hypothetical protein JTB14_037915 [Gonioctena quinquepunctata]
MKIQSKELLNQTKIATEDEKKSIILNNIDGLFYKVESDHEDVTHIGEYLEEEEQIKERLAENEGDNGTKSNEDELAESSNTRRTKFGRNAKNPSWMADYVVNDKDPVYECNQGTAVQVTETQIRNISMAKKDWSIHHIDITAAYLSAELNEDVYMEVPTGYDELAIELKHFFHKLPTTKEIEMKNFVCKLICSSSSRYSPMWVTSS